MQQAHRRLSALVVGVAVQLGTVVITATASAAPASEVELVEARLEIDTSEAGSGAEVLRRRIEERANVALRHGRVLPGDRDDVALGVVVRELGGDEPGYVVVLELRAADGSVVDEPTEVECSLCTETELVARVEAEIEAMIPALRELGDAQADVSEAGSSHAPPSRESEPAQPRLAHEAEPEPQPERRTRGAGMLAGGVSLLVLGGCSLGVGAGLSAIEPRVDEEQPLDLITTRPVGYGLLAGGVALAAAGAVLTALAVKQRRSTQWSLVPVAGRSEVGLIVGWRFP